MSLNKHACHIIALYSSMAISAGIAYALPQGNEVLRLMGDELGKIEKLSVSQQLVVYAEGFQNRPIAIEETLNYVFPDTLRSDIVFENIQRTVVRSPDISVVITDGQIEKEDKSVFDHYRDILLNRSVDSLEQKLRHAGVDLSVISLGRFNDKHVYVLGAEFPDSSHSQLWIDKNSFRPMRWILINGHNVGAIDIRYLEWQRIKGIWYPMRIEFYQDTVLVRVIIVNEVQTTPNFSGKLFDIEKLKAEAISQPNQCPAFRSETTEIQEIIEEFRKIYRTHPPAHPPSPQRGE